MPSGEKIQAQVRVLFPSLACVSPRAVPLSPLLGCLLKCWLLSAGGGSARPPWQDWPSAPPASLPGCSQLWGCPLNLHVPHQALAGPVGEVAQLALVPSNLLDEAASKMAIQDFTRGQGTKAEDKPFSCRKPLLGSAENFTVYIKNSIRFPKFKFSK